MTGCPTCGGAMPCDCADAVCAFTDLMVSELGANIDKGGRSVWTADHPATLLPEVADHAAKLHVAARELFRRRAGRAPRPLPWGDRPAEDMVREFAADTANMALMLLDSLDLLLPLPSSSKQPAQQRVSNVDFASGEGER